MKKVIILILTMIMFIIPVNASNILMNYNDTISGIKNYINSFDNYDKYILNNSEIPFIYKSNKVSYNSSFNGNSGLLNEIEFKLGKEYLYNGLSYWLVYDSKYIEVTPFYKDKGYINNTKSSSDTSGIKPTVFIKNNTSVKGEGSRLNPFEFARIYDVIISTSNKNYGLLKKNNTSEETETITQQVADGGVSTVIISPKEGYQYVKTSNANDCNNKVELLGKEDNILYLYNITNGFKCNVYFEPINYILTINPNGGMWNSTSSNSKLTITINSKTNINNPTKTGYTVTFNSNGGSTTTSLVSAVTFNNWTVTGKGSMSGNYFVGGSGDATLTANYNNGSITLPSTTKSGYTFDGWYTASSGGTKVGASGNSYTPTSNITLYAHWTSNKYTLTVNPNGGTWNGTTNVSTFTGAVGETKTITNPSGSIGYTVTFNSNGGSSASSKTSTKVFSRWTKSGSGTISGTTFTYGSGDSTLTANYNNGSITLPSTTRSGYTFEGWYTASSGGTYIGSSGHSYTPTSNTTLYAHWTQNTTTKYTLTVDPNGGTWNGTTSVSTFTGAVGETKTITNPSGSIGYTVTFNSNGGSSASSKASTKVFSGWTKSGSGTISGTTFTYGSGDSTLKANYNNGTVTLPSTTRSGYTFNGWYTASSGGSYVGSSGHSYTPTSNITLYAHWTQNSSSSSSWSVTLNTNGCGTVSTSSITVTSNKTYGDAGLPSSITNTTGYTFNGWYTSSSGGTKITTSTAVSTKYSTLYAQCSLITYKINYSMNYGTKGTNAPTSATYNSVVNIDNPTKTVKVTLNKNNTGATLSSTSASAAQTFAGWTASNLSTSTAKYGSSSSSVTTSWSSTSTKVTSKYFKNLQSTNNSTVTLTANWTQKSITLPTITKTGYTCGWATSSSATAYTYNSGGTYTPSSTGSTSVTLYGVCKDVPAPTLNLLMTDTNGTSGICSSGTCTFSDTFVLPITLYAAAESESEVTSIKLRWNDSNKTSYTSITSDYEEQKITKSNGKYNASRTLNSPGKRVLEVTATNAAGKKTVVTIKANVVAIKTMYVTGVNSGNVLRCRESDNTSATKVTGFTCGTKVSVYSTPTSNGWYYVINPGCYSSGDYLVSSSPSCSSTSTSTCTCKYKTKSYPYTNGFSTSYICSSVSKVCGNHAEFTNCTVANGQVTYRQWYYDCN